MTLPIEPQNAISEVLPLVERYSENTELSAAERADLRQWIDETTLLYGAWKPFKKLFKAVEARVLSGDFSDREMLVALLHKLDNFRLEKPARGALQASDTTTVQGENKTAKGDGYTYLIGGRRSWDYNGWRLVITPDQAANKSWAQTVDSVLSRLAGQDKKDAPKTSGALAWETKESSYIGGIKSASLKNGVLEVGVTYAYGGTDKNFALDVSDPTFPHYTDAGPQLKTQYYMKRRARRVLRKIGAQNPDEYWNILSSLLSTHGKNALDSEANWILLDALLGAKNRFELAHHGRGPLRVKRTFWRRAREERFSKIWDAHLDEVRALFFNEDVPLEANAVAFNVLRQSGTLRQNDDAELLMREVSSTQLNRFAEYVVLAPYALREILRRWESGEAVSGESAAHLLLRIGSSLRERVRVLIDEKVAQGDNNWARAFAKVLKAELADVSANEWGELSRRQRMAAWILVRKIPQEINTKTFWDLLSVWADLAPRAGEDSETIYAFMEERAAQAGREGKTQYFEQIGALPEYSRERIFAAFLRDVTQVKAVKDPQEVYRLVNSPDEQQNVLGWRYLIQANLSEKEMHNTWKSVIQVYRNAAVYLAAFSPYGLEAFKKVNWSSEDIQKIFPSDGSYYNYTIWRRFQNYVSAPFAAYLVSRLPEEERGARVLEIIATIKADERMAAFEQMRESLAGYAPPAESLQILLNSNHWAMREENTAFLHALNATAISSEVLQQIWQEILAFDMKAEATQPTLELLRRAELSDEQIFSFIRDTRSFDLSNLPNDVMAALLKRSPQSLIEMVGRASDEQRPAMRELLLRQLRDDEFLARFWNAVWPQLRDASTQNEASAAQRENLRQLVREKEIADSFARLSEGTFEEFLSTDEDEHEALLSRWLDAHLNELARDSHALLMAAMCPLSAVHTRALERLRVLGLDLPVALRLLESALPLAMREGEAFFEKAGRGSNDETRYALSLFDSPQKEVRDFGRRYIEARRDTVLNAQVLQQLGENSDPKLQAWIASEYSKAALQPQATAEFDRAVLRTRGKARKAREAVKTRLRENALSGGENVGREKIDALLELARGGASRDRDWALQQLTLLKLSGAEIPELTLAS